MSRYKLVTDGDDLEKRYWELFIQKDFPSYEIFWEKFIVPLTNRPQDIHFKTDQELKKIGKAANDICIAQLHYTILIHLARTYDFLDLSNNSKFIIDYNILSEGIMHLVGAQDIAFELLSRFKNPQKFDAWSDDDSKEAKREWQIENSYPLQQIRDYRNHLVHGRTMPKRKINKILYVPKIGMENKYFDWRLITNPSDHSRINKSDLLPPKEILNQAWLDTISYLNNTWKTVLLK